MRNFTVFVRHQDLQPGPFNLHQAVFQADLAPAWEQIGLFQKPVLPLAAQPDLIRSADLFKPSPAHDRDAVAQLTGLVKIVGHKQGTQAQPILQPFEFLAQIPGRAEIQVGKRLIQQEDLRPAGNGPSQRGPLLLTPAQGLRHSLAQPVHPE